MVQGYFGKIRTIMGILLNLGKIRITVMVMFTTAMGYLMAQKAFQIPMIYPLLGTFLLACGSAALNHWQDQILDGQMFRTKLRPIPSGRISSNQALGIALFWTLSGIGLLYWGAGFLPMILGITALIWYNGLYTYLKRLTPFAVIPGSIIGAIPPLIGWTAARGQLADQAILSVAMFLFIWQIPHFWLILLRNHKDYQKGSIPVFQNEKRLAGWTFWGTLATVISALSTSVTGGVRSPLSMGVLVLASLGLVYSVLSLRRGDLSKLSSAFRNINIYALSVIFVVSMDNLIF